MQEKNSRRKKSGQSCTSNVSDRIFTYTKSGNYYIKIRKIQCEGLVECEKPCWDGCRFKTLMPCRQLQNAGCGMKFRDCDFITRYKV